MSRIEDQVRDSLRHRAEDVEPTPALWHEVDRRIARRRRFRVTSWSLSLVAAALVAFLVVPGLLGGADPDRLEIEPMGPAGGVVPSAAVVAADGELWLLDLATGERTSLDLGNAEPVQQIAVAPGSTLDDYRIAVVQTNPDGGAQFTFEYGPAGGGVTGILEAHAVEPGFVPTVTWSPDGGSVAYTVPDGDGEAAVVVEAAPDDVDGFLEPRGADGVGTIGEDDVLLDWFGPVGEAGDVSELLVRRADDRLGILNVEAIGPSEAFRSLSDGELAVPDGWGGSVDTIVSGVAAAVAADPNGAVMGFPMYMLAPGRQAGTSLFWAGGPGGADDTPPVEVPLGDVVGDTDLDALWLDAAQDAALIGDGDRLWLFAHDGDGDFAPAVEVATDVTVAALFDAPRAATDEDTEQADPEPSPDDPEPDSDDPEPDSDDPEPGTDGDAVTRGTFPEPVLTVAGTELRLLREDGSEQAYELNLEGNAYVAGLAVRPGSTPADLTVLVLTVSDGIWDLWDVRILDGRLTRDPVPGEFLSGMNAAAGAGVRVRGPLWAPDGSAFAWIGSGTGSPQLRIVGWDEGPGTGRTADDNAVFELPRALEGAVLHGWRSMPSSSNEPERFRMDFTQVDQLESALSLVIERQGDGAWAIPSGGAGPLIEHGWSNVAAFGGEFQEDIGWAIRLTSDGLVLAEGPDGTDAVTPLPDDLLAGEAWPDLWVAEFEDGAIVVGSRDVGTSHLVTADRQVEPVAGSATGAAAIR